MTYDLFAALYRLGSLLDGIDYFDVPSAAAQISGDCFLDLIARGMNILVQQGASGYQHSRSAYPTLGAAAFEECALKRIEPTVTSKPFDSKNGRAVHLAHRNETRVNHFSVDYHRAGSALAFATAFFCSRETQVLAQHIEQPLHGRRIDSTRHTVNMNLYLHKA